MDYYGGAGVQHIALNTQDIIKTVSALMFNSYTKIVCNLFIIIIPMSSIGEKSQITWCRVSPGARQLL